MPSRPATKKAKKSKPPKAASTAAPPKRKQIATRPVKSTPVSMYLHVSDCTLTWTSTKPKPRQARGPYVDLATAKAAALDALIAAIERAETLLSAARHCDSLEALHKVSAVKK